MPNISLCLIVGNVQEYIYRCLESFLPIADEVVLISAIGNQTPDDTFTIADRAAQSYAQSKNGRYVPIKFGHYKNQPGHEDWPHVDDFAAARQMSFDLASNEYCFWCDSDDILKSGADRIRRHAREGSFACFIFPYDVFGKNVVVPRERMMRKDSGRWQFPVHEAFKFRVEPVHAAMDDGVIIQHLPRLDKKGGNDRNLRILESIPPADMHVGLKYHLFGELMCAQRKDEAVVLATKLLTEEKLGKDERYDLLMSLVLQTKDLEQQTTLLHAAHMADPERREALGVLACVMMDLNKPASALAYARQMIATTEPEVQSWNSRQPFYGYTGDDIFAQALRFAGRTDQAEIVRRESLKRHGGPTIALLHASRGRPEKASRCRKAWHDLAAQPGRLEHVFAIDEDDRESDLLRRFHHVVVPKGGGCVRAWNAAAAATCAPVLLQLSDDWIPIPKWDELILERLGDLNLPRVLAISDGHRTDDLLCMAICTRTYYNQDFFLFHPWFTGVYSDNWFTEQAYARGAVIDAKDIVFEHQHPAFDKNVPMDETYARQNDLDRYAQGDQTLKQLQTKTDWSTVPGFFNYWLFYENVARRLKDGDVVAEIGVWLGRSLIHLAQECQRLGKHVRFYAVDHFKGESNQVEHEATVRACGGNLRASFEANARRCGIHHMITILDGDSADMAGHIPDASLAFCFVDAAHDYDSVRRDLLAWSPKVRPDGLLAGHDAQHEPVMRAVRELFPKAMTLGCLWLKQ